MEVIGKKRWLRWCALLCMACTVFALFGGAIQAQAAGTGAIYGSEAYAEKGETATVAFTISDNPGLWGLKGSISYDSSVLTLKSVAAGNVFSSSEIIVDEDLSKNPFVFLATGSTIADKTKNGTLIRLTFAVNPNAKLGSYDIRFSVKQSINANGDDVPVKSFIAKITVSECLHRNTELRNVVPATEETEGYSGDSYCKKCGTLVKQGQKTPVYVNTCPHTTKTTTVVTEATCEAAGAADITCTDCGKVLSQEVIPALGHTETGPVNAVPASTTQEGYTGDMVCSVCSKILTQGSIIPKFPILVFKMASPAEDTYVRASQAGLVFVSEADLDTFVRVEVDGSVLDGLSYTVESGSTKVTLKPEYLEKLSDGKHTITIVSDAGTASAQFSVAAKAPAKGIGGGSVNTVLVIVTIVAVLIAVACVVLTLINEQKRYRNARYGKHDK